MLLRVVIAAVLLFGSGTRADTLAWWRFEDHPTGDKLDAKLGTDESPLTTTRSAIDDHNPLRTFNTRPDLAPPDTCPTFVDIPELPKLAGDVSNVRCARFVGSEDFYTAPRPDGPPPIDRARLDRFTVEGLFKLSALSRDVGDRYQVIVGKDGRPTDRPFQPLVVVVAGTDDEFMSRDCLSVNMIDRAGHYVAAPSRTKLERDRWYAFAAVCDGSSLKLYLNRFDGRGYQLEGEAKVDGGLIESTGTWTVGRGMFDLGPNSWLQGFADEIRISDEPLAKEKFLAAGIDRTQRVASPPENLPPPTKCVSDLADPTVLFHEGVYYLYGTAADGKGIDLYTSRDLKTWQRGGRLIQPGPGVWGDNDFWAPGAIEHGGKFYLFYSTSGLLPDAGHPRTARINIAIADSPAGPFKEVVARLPLIGRAVIDPQPFIDLDGKAYLYFVGDVSEGRGQVYVARLADDLLSIVGEPIRCFEASQPWEGSTWNEAPFVFRDGDTYVLMYSGNFWASHDYAVGYATSPSPLGPWAKSDDNPILRKWAGLFGTGHNCVIPSPDGKGLLNFFHAHRSKTDAARDVYVNRIEVGRDGLGRVKLKVATK